jgi:hypothetical protein
MSTPNIDGSWKNELDSTMVLLTKGAEITGIYSTAVGDE